LEEGTLSDDDSNITSEDCEDNEALFAMMEDDDRKNHLKGLWKKLTLKVELGLKLFDSLQTLQGRYIYLEYLKN
jgi:hypothetical protein